MIDDDERHVVGERTTARRRPHRHALEQRVGKRVDRKRGAAGYGARQLVVAEGR